MSNFKLKFLWPNCLFENTYIPFKFTAVTVLSGLNRSNKQSIYSHGLDLYTAILKSNFFEYKTNLEDDKLYGTLSGFTGLDHIYSPKNFSEHLTYFDSYKALTGITVTGNDIAPVIFN